MKRFGFKTISDAIPRPRQKTRRKRVAGLHTRRMQSSALCC